MSFSLSPKQRKQASVAVLATVAVVGVASLVFKTYPHLKPDFLKSKKELGQDSKASKKEHSVDSTLVVDSTVIVNSDYADLPDAMLREFLQEKEITVPEDAGHAELVALATSVSEE